MITEDVQKLNPGAEINLYALDLSPVGGGFLRFHGHMQDDSIIWNGEAYTPWAIHAEGFEVTGTGQPPQPKLAVGNIGTDAEGNPLPNVISSMCEALQDFVGCKVIRIQTYSKYLDAANFPGGNPSANPNEAFVDTWTIAKKVESVQESVTFQLRSPMEFNNQKLPGRQVVADVCQWIEISGYRGPDCAYNGPMYDIKDQPTTDPVKDSCAGYLSSCKRRFGENEELSIGCFPTADRLRGY